MIPSQICDGLIIPSQVCDGTIIPQYFVTNLRPICDRSLLIKIHCIIYFFYIFINIKIFKKKPVKETKIDSTTYRNSL